MSERGAPASAEGSARRRAAALLALPIGLVLLWTVVWPNVAVVAGAFGASTVEGAGAGLGLQHWRDFWASPADREALWTTLWISAASVGASVLVGAPLALLLSRAEFPGRRLVAAVATLPAALPPLVGVLAFLFLYGESGIVTRVVQRLLGLEEAPWRLSGPWAIVFVHAYTMYVYVYLFVQAGLARLDPSLDEAARGLGLPAWKRLVRVTLPLLAPALAGSSLLVFMSSLGSFSAPYVFGGGLRVLSTQIVVSRLNGDVGMAYVETTVLALSAVAAVLLLGWLERRRPPVTGAGKGARAVRRPVARGWARGLVALAAAVATLVLVLPHLVILLIAFAKDGAWTTELLPPTYTLANVRKVLTEPGLWGPVRNSVAMGLVSTLAAMLVCGLGAYLVVLRRFPGRRLLQLLLVLPWAIPATAIAIGLASTFDRTDPASLRVLLVGTWWILPLAYFVRAVPLVASAVEGSLRQMDPSLEDAARGLGASWARTMRRVILPAARPGLVAGATLAMITAVGEFVASVVLYTHHNRPMSMEILAQVRQLSFGGAAAYSALLLGIVLLVTLFARLVGEEGTGSAAVDLEAVPDDAGGAVPPRAAPAA